MAFLNFLYFYFFTKNEGFILAFYNNYVRLCAENNMSPSAAAIAIGLKKSNVTYWKNGRNNPSDVTLAKIANFFGVTVEELMGETDDPSAGIKKDPIPKDEDEDSETAELREIWSSADENERRDLLEMARMLKSRRKQNG